LNIHSFTNFGDTFGHGFHGPLVTCRWIASDGQLELLSNEEVNRAIAWQINSNGITRGRQNNSGETGNQ
jgi:hypothetical protein